MTITVVSGPTLLYDWSAVSNGVNLHGPRIVWSDAGLMVAAWSNLDAQVRAIRVDATGNPVGDVIEPVVGSADFVDLSGLATQADGSFAFAWLEATTSSPPQVLDEGFAFFDASGTDQAGRVGGWPSVNFDEATPQVLALANGDYLLVRMGQKQTKNGPIDLLQGQVFDPDGTAQGGRFTLSDDYARPAAATGLPDGNGVLLYTTFVGNTGKYRLMGQLVDESGAPTGEAFVVRTLAGSDHLFMHGRGDLDVVPLATGGFAVVWAEAHGPLADPNTPAGAVMVQLMSASGVRLGGPITVESSANIKSLIDISIVELANGGFAVSTTGTAGPSVGQSPVYLYDMHGNALGPAEDLGGGFFDLELTSLGQIAGLSVGFGGATSTVLDFGIGNDVVGTAGNDKLYGKSRLDDVIEGQDGNDVLVGLAGDDDLRGGEGNDVLDGGAGMDDLAGGLGDDVYVVIDLADTIVESPGEGSDTVLSAVISLDLADFTGIENLALAGSAALSLTGDAADNRLTGNVGANTLTGNAGLDVLTGGRGRDVLTGGADADVFDFNSKLDSKKGGQRDHITDFERGLDKIDLSTIDAVKGAGNQAFKWIGKKGFHGVAGELHLVKNGGYVLVEGDIDGNGKADFQIQLDGLSGIGKGDFIL